MLVENIEQEKIIAIIRDVELNKIIPLVRALYVGGISFVEVTFPQDENPKTTCELIKLIKNCLYGAMHVGAGTVLTKKQVKLAKKAGCEFIVSPNTCKDVIKLTKKLKMISIPGAFTPTEVSTAMKYGADFVKLFPASELSTSYIKAIHSPLKNAKLMAFGGVEINNIKEYLDAGICGFGIGSNIIDKKMIDNNDFEGITALAKKYVESVKTK